MIQVNPEETLISEKRPLNKKVFTKFIKLNEGKNVKMSKKLKFLGKINVARQNSNIEDTKTTEQQLIATIQQSINENMLYEAIRERKDDKKRQSIYIEQSSDVSDMEKSVDQKEFTKQQTSSQHQSTKFQQVNSSHKQSSIYNTQLIQLTNEQHTDQNESKISSNVTKEQICKQTSDLEILKTQEKKGKNKRDSSFMFNNFQTLYTRTIPEELNESSYSAYSESILSDTEQNLFSRTSTKKTLPSAENVSENVNTSNLSTNKQSSQLLCQKNKKENDNKLNKLHHQIKQTIYVEEQYQNGGRYEGYLLNGQKNGHGTFYYKNGGYYQGMWRNNAMNGQGKLYYDNGKLAYDGQWYLSQFHGKGRVYNDTAMQLSQPFDFTDFNSNIEDYWTHYEGQLSHDTKVGYGKIYLSNGEYFEGTFSDDNIHGKGKFHSLKNNKEVIRGIWNKGILVQIIEIIPEEHFNFIKENQKQQNQQVDSCEVDQPQESEKTFKEIQIPHQTEKPIQADEIIQGDEEIEQRQKLIKDMYIQSQSI